jgi:hypothetical protein
MSYFRGFSIDRIKNALFMPSRFISHTAITYAAGPIDQGQGGRGYTGLSSRRNMTRVLQNEIGT